MASKRTVRPLIAVGASVAVVTTLVVAAPSVSTSSVGAGVDAAADYQPGPTGHTPRGIAGPYWDTNPDGIDQSIAASPMSDPWPSAASIVDRMRAYGLDIQLMPGYDDPVYERNANLAGSGSRPVVFMMHDTGTGVPASRLRNDHSLNWIMYGVKSSAGNTVRASHFYIDRSGNPYFVYARRTWHAGAGDAMFGVSATRMNAWSYGVEIESQGGPARDLTAKQRDTAAKMAAAVLDVTGIPVANVINHKDYAGRVQGKVDTGWSMSYWQNLVSQAMAAGPDVANPDVGTVPPTEPVRDPWGRLIKGEVIRTDVQFGKSNRSVMRTQAKLRQFSKKNGKFHRKLNPSGKTGYFGHETRRMINRTHQILSLRWKRFSKHSATAPKKGLFTKIGLTSVNERRYL